MREHATGIDQGRCTGRSDANSYTSAADGDAYFDGHLYATAWTAATVANREKALVFATRLIDAEFQFHGSRAVETQALQWPREGCPHVDRTNVEWASDVVPQLVVNATCELARELLIADRTAAPDGEGLKYLNDGTVQKGFDKEDRRPIISRVVQAMLGKLGVLIRARSESVRLVRS